MERFICIHGHFYQPPRENPWLETVELQDSAAPYHDWNERITAECYMPNATARILDGEGRIDQITSNYSRISFNFGPTLLAWMLEKKPHVHEAIVVADRLSREHFGGHGSALAQAYNHMILPLANTRDKYTQVRWGVRDFEHRFGRAPEGMWLPETAADNATLEVLANVGIGFTILSPFQASRTKEIGRRNSREVNGGEIDPTRPYRVVLPSGKAMTVFFYDGPVSQAVAFERLLVSGERFAGRLMSAFNERRAWEQLVNIATDGESYGHHHRYGEMALAYALKHIEEKKLARLTNYGQFLEGHRPTHEAQIHQPSSWSCSHGVGRWMLNCGCNSGGHPEWNQGWRTPLRHSLDWLRDELAPLYENSARQLVRDPWQARDAYIEIILDRSAESRERFFAAQAARPLSEAEKVQVLKLLELQRHAMLMYTSCGWFFDEISGLESVQVVQYAARALQLGRELFNRDLEAGFLKIFEGAKSNLPQAGDGRRIFSLYVKPAMLDSPQVTAHYAISSLFQQYGASTRLFSYSFQDEAREVLSSGKTHLTVGHTRVISDITQESYQYSYAILHMGEHNVTGGVRPFKNMESYESALRELQEAYDRADFAEVIRLIDRHFGPAAYSLRSLFRDEQRRILKEILQSTREDLEGRFRLIAERYAPLMKFLKSAGAPLPAGLDTATDFVLHQDICHAVESSPLDLDRLKSLLQEAEARGAHVLDPQLSFVIKNRMEEMMQQIAVNPSEIEPIRCLERFTSVVMLLPLGLNLAKVQNVYWEMLQKAFPEFRHAAVDGSESAQIWLKDFLDLGERLGFAVKRWREGLQELKQAA
jgi:alpha-amylase/alpha-mannosidase (GH57 family)